MNNFERGLPENAIAELEGLMSCKTSWWPDLLAHWAPNGSGGSQQFPLRLVIRKDYINFYSSGQSIAKILFRQRRNTPMLEIHQKYVKGKHAKEQQYLKFSAREGADTDGHSVAWGGREMLRKWILNRARIGESRSHESKPLSRDRRR